MKHDNDMLLILAPGFAASETDTVCLPMQQSLVKTLLKENPDLNIIILAFQYPYHTKTYKWFGATVTCFNGKNKGGLNRLLLRRTINKTLSGLKNKYKIIGILSFWYGECAFVGKKFAEKNHLKHYCWILGQDAKKENKYPGKILPEKTELISLSDFLKDEFEKNHNVRPLHLIPPGIDDNSHYDLQRERTIDIIGAGSLLALKRYDIFIELIADLKKTIPAIKAVLIGGGPEKERLKALIIKNDLLENCILTGELPHEKVMDFFLQARILLHPSSYEGFSGVCQEALYCGAHVVSFCKPMKNDIEQWYIVADNDAMYKKALSILQDHNTSHQQINPYPMKVTAKKMMELFIV
ncbi:hypothetical protein BH11BAC4_BH11BAC4_07120 [soil metagenome]